MVDYKLFLALAAWLTFMSVPPDPVRPCALALHSACSPEGHARDLCVSTTSSDGALFPLCSLRYGYGYLYGLASMVPETFGL